MMIPLWFLIPAYFFIGWYLASDQYGYYCSLHYFKPSPLKYYLVIGGLFFFWPIMMIVSVLIVVLCYAAAILHSWTDL